jgi:hypothetical protein
MKVPIGGTQYDVQVVERARVPDALAIVVPCYQAFDLTRVCLDAIERFTDVPHEVWVVDNGSAPAVVERLRAETRANLILNRTTPWNRGGGILGWLRPWYRRPGGGSIANAVALELAARFATPRWMWVMHNDSLPCRRGWASYMLGKLGGKVKGAGVREDEIRVHAMHQSGFVFEFALFRELGMSFLPSLPAYDVGDLVTVKLRDAGYEYFVCANLHNRPELREGLPADHWLRDINCDIAFDEAGTPIYLHLGRGTFRYSKPGSAQARALSLEDWLRLVRAHVLDHSAA